MIDAGLKATLGALQNSRHGGAPQRIELLVAACGDTWPVAVWDLVRARAIPFWAKQPTVEDMIDSGFEEANEDDVDTEDVPLLWVIVEALRRDPTAASSEDVAALFRRTPWKDFERLAEPVLPGWPSWAHELALLTLRRDPSARASLEKRAPAVVRRGLSLAALEIGQGGSEDDAAQSLTGVVRAALDERSPDAFAVGARLGFGPDVVVATAAAVAAEQPRGWFDVVPFLKRGPIEHARHLVEACESNDRPYCDAEFLSDAALTSDAWLLLGELRLDTPAEGAESVAELCAIGALMCAPDPAGLPASFDSLLALRAIVYPRTCYVPRLARLGADRLVQILSKPYVLERRGAAYLIAALRSLGPIDEAHAPLLRRWAAEMLARGYRMEDKAEYLAEAGAAIVPFIDELRRRCTDNLQRRALEIGALGALWCGHLDGIPVPESEDARLLYSQALAWSAGAASYYARLWPTLPKARLELILEIIKNGAGMPLERYLEHDPQLLTFWEGTRG